MIRYILLLVFISPNTYGASVISKIPEEYWGTWASTKDQCQNEFAESRLKISKRGIEYIESFDKLITGALDKNTILLIVESRGEGEVRLGTKKLELHDSNTKLDDFTGGYRAPFKIRCPVNQPNNEF